MYISFSQNNSTIIKKTNEIVVHTKNVCSESCNLVYNKICGICGIFFNTKEHWNNVNIQFLKNVDDLNEEYVINNIQNIDMETLKDAVYLITSKIEIIRSGYIKQMSNMYIYALSMLSYVFSDTLRLIRHVRKSEEIVVDVKQLESMMKILNDEIEQRNQKLLTYVE